MRRLVSTIVLALALSTTGAWAQQKADPGTSPTSDPARSSASKGLNTTTTGESRSGSGNATSGGRDDNGDQGRDKMPDSSIGVRPYDKQPQRHAE